ncbi:NAD(P)-dependent alcohol dehydrogenase [Aspergillus undulatus]|uniref:NAD(P)-dependent alcohol dehydrogenase n=1 Tax=Aspergillus undulatus TaxID=1810928 RepID=UPI003CCE406E
MSVTYDVYRGSASGAIVPASTTQTIAPHEVYIETTHSGLCGTDEHYLKADQVLGHEGIGIVKAVGSTVTSVKVGDRVGFGYTHKICAECDNCAAGVDQFCRTGTNYGFGDLQNGTFGSGAIWDSKCVYPIPEGYDSAYAAPLMCAGATVWTVLTEFGIKPAERVGIMGMGGLGHIAIKLAAAMGYHVVVLSSSDRKREEAMEYGAAEYHVIRAGEETPKELVPVKHLLLCGSFGVDDYSLLLPLVDTCSSIYPLTVSFEPAKIPTLDLLFKGVRVQGSLVASRQSIRGLLKFAAAKKIYPTIMTFPLSKEGIEEAMAALREGKIRYRAVLVR